jgi:hypothetical protein
MMVSKSRFGNNKRLNFDDWFSVITFLSLCESNCDEQAMDLNEWEKNMTISSAKEPFHFNYAPCYQVIKTKKRRPETLYTFNNYYNKLRFALSIVSNIFWIFGFLDVFSRHRYYGGN